MINNKILLEDYANVSKTIKQLAIKNKTFLITGASGTLAKFLINSLITSNNLNKSNNKIIAVSRDKKKIKKLFAKDKNISCKDYKDKINEKANYIIHFAAPTESKFFVEHPIETFDCIYNLTDRFLKLAKAKNARFVYISSMEVYGLVKDNKPKSEGELGYISLDTPRSSYSLGKRLAESLCHSHFNQNNTNVVIARLAQTFGAGSNLNDTRLYSYAMNCVINNKNIVLSTNGQSYGNYVYLSDAINAIFYIAIKGEINETYNVAGNKSNVKIIDFCKLMANEKVKVICNTGKNYFPENTKLNMSINKIKKIGWKPNYNLKDTIQRYKNYLS